jgi:hypothetical protein
VVVGGDVEELAGLDDEASHGHVLQGGRGVA